MEHEGLRQRFATLTTAHLADACIRAGLPVRCAPADGRPAEPSFHFDVRFLIHAPAGAREQLSAESAALAWFAGDDLPSPLAPSTSRQIRPALARFS